MISDEFLFEEFERIQHDFENQDINVKCLQTLAEFDVGDKKVRLSKGAKIKLPFWIAIILEKEEYVEIEDMSELDFPSLYKMALKEEENIDLQKMNNYFYIAMRETLEEYTKSGKVMRYGQQEKIEMKLRDLMKFRLSKIIKIAEKGKNVTSKIRNMSPEEKWLVEIVSEAVEKWWKMVQVSPDTNE